MNGYENGKIYKLVDKNDNIIYIGSTKTSLKERWYGHHLKCDQNKIVLIENYPCESYEELRKGEQNFIDLYNEMGLLNKQKAYCSKEERNQNQKKYDKSDEGKAKKKNYQQSEKYKQSHKEQLKIKANCPNCEKLITKRYISEHTRLYCKEKPIDNN